MLTAHEVEKYLATFNPNGKLNPEEVFLFGGPEDEVRGICVTWMATSEAIRHAVEQGCNMIVCHEAITFYDYPVWKDYALVKDPWPSDRLRLHLLAKHTMTVLRAHSTVDPTHVGPALWDSLRLPAPQFSGSVYSHHTVEPITVAALAARMREGLGLDAVRVTGDPDRTVTEVGTCWGGGGMDRHMDIWVAYMLPRGIEALIVGETSDFAQRFASECGIALLEGGHSGTEDPGMCRLASDLAKQFPNVKTLHRPQEIPWVTR